MAESTALPIPSSAFTDPKTGRLSREGYRFLFSLNRNTNEAAAGSVTTQSGSGLQGGGSVSDGISLSIAPNGVTNAMLRQSVGNSVLGRFAGSTGNVADIVAVDDNSVLARQGGVVVFTSDPQVDSIRTGSLRIDQTPVAETVTCTHTLTINLDGTNWKIPIKAA